MLKLCLRDIWRRLSRLWPWSRETTPIWGSGPPNILGICQVCGAVVLEGWHQQQGNAYLCRRCAGKDASRHPRVKEGGDPASAP